jgi:Uncharacterised conserved protein (DUF2228)
MSIGVQNVTMISPESQLLEKLYGFPFPSSFFEFQGFIQKLLSRSPQRLDGLMNMVLGEVFGVFDAERIGEDFNPVKTDRSYQDPPEFFTIMHGLTDGLHWGYYLDDPKDLGNICVVSYYNNDAFELQIDGYTIFEAFRTELESQYAGHQQNIIDDYDYAPDYQARLASLDRVREILMTYETQDRPEFGDEYTEKYRITRKTTAPTRDNMGIVVPQELFRHLAKIDRFQDWNYSPTPQAVQELQKEAMQAVADGFPGTALKAGKDLWVYRDYCETAYSLLDAAYQALDRPLLSATLKIARTFRKDCDCKHV